MKTKKFTVKYHSQDAYPVTEIKCDSISYSNPHYLICKNRAFIFSKTIALIPHAYVYEVR